MIEPNVIMAAPITCIKVMEIIVYSYIHCQFLIIARPEEGRPTKKLKVDFRSVPYIHSVIAKVLSLDSLQK